MKQKTKRELQQRLLKFDALRGLILAVLGTVIGITAWVVEQHVILIACEGIMVWLWVEGIWRIIKNPVKQQIAMDMARAQHWRDSPLGFDPTGITKPIVRIPNENPVSKNQ